MSGKGGMHMKNKIRTILFCAAVIIATACLIDFSADLLFYDRASVEPKYFAVLIPFLTGIFLVNCPPLRC